MKLGIGVSMLTKISFMKNEKPVKSSCLGLW